MRIGLLFEHFGGYHVARLRGAQAVATENGGEVQGLEIVSQSSEHPWQTEALSRAAGVWRLADYQGDLSRLLDVFRPEVLAIPGWGYAFSRQALRWCRRRGIPAVLMSESRRCDAPRQWWKETMKSWLWVRHFSTALVGGQSHEEYLVSLGFKPDRIFRGYNVVDNAYFEQRARQARAEREQTRPRLGLGPDGNFFLAVSRFVPRKNLDGLIRAYAAYRSAADNPWDLVILGEGELKEKLVALVQELQLDQRVYFPGFSNYETTAHWYGLAGALIHPALSEPWGLVVNEALAAGLPVLVSRNCGCYPELVEDQVNGLGFDPENIDELTNKMIQISTEIWQRDPMAGPGRLKQGFAPRDFGLGLMQAAQAALEAPMKQ